MSGQPNRYASDPADFRAEYMKQLGQRADLDTMNYNVNKVFKSTGNLPPQSVPDNRSTSEILADSEKLKLSIISDFKPIASQQMASELIQRVQTSPYNADGSLFVFLAQNAPEIVSNLKKKYKFGIKGDSNDVEQMLSFLVSTYSTTKELSGTVKSAFNRPISSRSGISQNDLDTIMRDYTTIAHTLLSKQNGPTALSVKLRYTAQTMAMLNKLISSKEYNDMKDLFVTLGTSPRAVQQLGANSQQILDAGYKQYLTFIDNLPNASNVKALISQLNKSIKNSNDALSIQILDNIVGLFPDDNAVLFMNNFVDQLAPESARILGRHQNLGNLGNPGSSTASSSSATPQLNFPSSSSSSVGSEWESGSQWSVPSSIQTGETSLSTGASPSGYSAPASLQLPSTASFTVSSSSQAPGTYDYSFGSLPSSHPSASYSASSFPSSYDLPAVPGRKPPPQPTFIPSNPSSSKSASTKTSGFTDLNSYILTSLVRDVVKIILLGFDLGKDDDEIYEQLATVIDVWKSEQEALSTPGSSYDIHKWMEDSNFDQATFERFFSEELPQLREEYDRGDWSATKQRDVDALIRQFVVMLNGQGFEGNGLKKKRRGRPKGSGIAFKDRVDKDKGIAPVKRYVSFGKYLINAHKLKDNIMAIKSSSGTNVRQFPSTRLSQPLAHIIKTIVGGNVPSFEDLNKLSDEEKHYLHKVATQSEIIDKLSIPSPSKDQREKDINEFEILKGEIMSGNDNKEMIKRFKIMVLKFAKIGLLPKREASEVMQELIEMGY